MDCPGEQLFASAALAAQQYRDVSGRHFFDVAQHPRHFRAARDDPIDRRCRVGLLELAVLGLQVEYALGTCDDQLQHVDIDGLLVEVVSAQRDRSQGVLAGFVASGNDDFRCRCDRQDVGQNCQPLRGAVGIRRKPKIDDRHRRGVLI